MVEKGPVEVALSPFARIKTRPTRSAWDKARQVLRQVARNKSALLGTTILLIILTAALFAPQLAPRDPNKQNLSQRLQPPSLRSLLGTDQYGRDILSRLIFGSRISLMIGVVAVFIGMIIGLLAGLVSGFYGGLVDSLLMRFVDMLMVLPTLILALSILAVLGPDMSNVMIAVGISISPRFARMLRSSVLAAKESEYVEATRAMGGGDLRIMFLHILPNCLSPTIVVTSLMIANCILVEANLSFLGLGAPPPAPAWGSMISEGLRYLRSAPWLSTFSGFAIMLAVLGFNLLGDGLRDLLDPRLRTEDG